MRNKVFRSKRGFTFLETKPDLKSNRPVALIISDKHSIIGGVENGALNENGSKQMIGSEQPTGIGIILKENVDEKTIQMLLKDIKEKNTVEFIIQAHETHQQHKMRTLREARDRESDQESLER